MILFHPKFAKRPCRECHKYQYNDEGDILIRGGFYKVELDIWNAPPCNGCPKIPKGELQHADKAIELNNKNSQAYYHWRTWNSVGGFPRSIAEDEIVRRNALIISQLHDQYHRQPIQELISTVLVVNSLGKK